MTYYQYDLHSDHGDHRTCWLCWGRKLKPGETVSLKHETYLWKILKAYDESRDTPPDASWKVGGLV